MQPGRDIGVLLQIMARLRDRQSGCPWDIEQDFDSIAPYTLEEAHEVTDAIARKDYDDLCEELGDLLLQVVFHAQMAEEAGLFAFGDVVHAITRKMIRRHPHVFGPHVSGDAGARSSGMVKGQWAAIKAEEKAERAARRKARGLAPDPATGSILAGVGNGLSAFQQAVKLQEMAATVGFDWKQAEPILAKIREEVTEIEEEMSKSPPEVERLRAELGDVLFAVANLARHLGLDPEQALRQTNITFRSRFMAMEAMLAETGERPADKSLDELEELWVRAKRRERGQP